MDNNFTPEKLLEQLKAKFAHLNDNDATAIKVYNSIINKGK